jgi:hypothetical protein
MFLSPSSMISHPRNLEFRGIKIIFDNSKNKCITSTKSFLIKLLLRNKKFRSPTQNVREIFVSAGHFQISEASPKASFSSRKNVTKV